MVKHQYEIYKYKNIDWSFLLRIPSTLRCSLYPSFIYIVASIPQKSGRHDILFLTLHVTTTIYRCKCYFQKQRELTLRLTTPYFSRIWKFLNFKRAGVSTFKILSRQQINNLTLQTCLRNGTYKCVTNSYLQQQQPEAFNSLRFSCRS